jgi:Protein of unknown function (DUF4058)
MPSPFPGMDPYLEATEIWPDLHQRLATHLSGELNRCLPRPYYARVEMRAELAIVTEEGRAERPIIPDVFVMRRSDPQSTAAAVLTSTERSISRWVEFNLSEESFHHYFVEIRDSTQSHFLTTLIEILSPSNKRPGPDRNHYSRKQREVLESDTNLVEIDLLRTGRRVLPTPGLASNVSRLEPPPDYVVFSSPAWRRGSTALGYRAFPFSVREILPCIAIPLKELLPEVALDLQRVFDRAYDDGPYQRGAIDYSRPPDPPLADDDALWADALLVERGVRSASA